MGVIVTPQLRYREVFNHVRLHHPRCPGEAVHAIAQRVLSKPRWQGQKLGKAVGIEMLNVARHMFTNYDALFEQIDMDRETARAMIAPKISKILAKWDRPKAVCERTEA